MTLLKLQFASGINHNLTNYAGKGMWSDCDKIRFKDTFPEKIGGWQKYTYQTCRGVVRAAHNWSTTQSNTLLAFGSNEKVMLELGGALYNITPLRALDPAITITNNISTVLGSYDIQLQTPSSHNLNTGDWVSLSGATSVGGISATNINGDFTVSVVDSTKFKVTTQAQATSTATGGGTVTISCEIPIGYPTTTEGYGYGAGTWGSGTWGSGATTPVNLPLRKWFFDNFDNDLFGNYNVGPIYTWERGVSIDPSTALSTRMVTLTSLATARGFSASAVPAAVTQIMVSQNDKHLIAFGAVPFGSTSINDFDPMLIRWADQDTPENWTPTTTNSAGFIRVSRGSKIVRALAAGQEILVFTDAGLWSMQFLGTSDVFSLQEIATNISILSSGSVATVSGTSYWMGNGSFYMYNGAVSTLPCSVSKYVFSNINKDQAEQIVCGTNKNWDEIWWFYPSSGSLYNDRYVVFNYVENVWYYGTMARSAWLDTPLKTNPIGIGFNPATDISTIYSHEITNDADGQAFEAYITSNDFELSDGNKFALSKRIIPDIDFSRSNVVSPLATFELRPRSFPGGVYQTNSSEVGTVFASVSNYTTQVFVRARARQMAIKVGSNALGVHWQLGIPRIDLRPDGGR